MRPSCVVELDEAGKLHPGLADQVVGIQVHLVALDCAPQAFNEDAVAATALAIHADLDAARLQDRGECLAGELAAVVGSLRPQCRTRYVRPARPDCRIGCPDFSESSGLPVCCFHQRNVTRCDSVF